ncbi:MAG: carbon storage regulator [Planctomycetaceae bacterium]
MLVLTRKKSEMIQIGENIVVKVIRTGKGHVKIGIEAPADVRVLRAELCGEESAETKVEAEAETEEASPLKLIVA